MDLDPCLDQFHAVFLNTALDDLTIWNPDNRLFTLILDVDMRTVVLPCVEELQGYDNSVEHGNDGHDGSFVEIPVFSILFAHRRA